MGTGEGTRLQAGLTWRSILALVFAATLLGPVNIFLYLSAGGYLLTGTSFIIGAPAVFITIMLFTEMSRLLGAPLRKQEVFIIYNLIPATLAQTIFVDLLFNYFVRNSSMSYFFTDPLTNLPLPLAIPGWFAPPVGLDLRTFLHYAWAWPVLVAVLAVLLFSAYEIGLGFLSAHLFIEVERLPFPYASVDAEAIVTMAERDPQRMKVFSFGAVISMAWSVISIAIPMITTSFFAAGGGQFYFVPGLWDLTTYLDKFVPGIIFGVTFEPFAYTWGFMLSRGTVLWILIGSFALWIVGNPVILRVQNPLFVEFQAEYRTGMGWNPVWWRANLWVWMSFIMGAAIGAAVITMIRGWRYMARSFKSLARLRASTGGGYLPLPLVLALILLGGGGFIFLVYMLVPSFPLWVIALVIGAYAFINTLINARGLGETGFGVNIPFVREGSILSSGYRGVDIWFAPMWVPGSGAANYSKMVKVAFLTETKPMDYLKTFVLMLPVTLLVNFAIVSLFWSMAPIPSAVYGAVVYGWPDQVANLAFMITRAPQLYKPPLILSGFVTSALLTSLSSFIRIPGFTIMGLLAGFSIAPPYAIALLVGNLVGDLFFRRRFGEDWWQRYRAVILAGVAAGYGLTGGLSAVWVMVSRALWYSSATY